MLSGIGGAILFMPLVLVVFALLGPEYMPVTPVAPIEISLLTARPSFSARASFPRRVGTGSDRRRIDNFASRGSHSPPTAPHGSEPLLPAIALWPTVSLCAAGTRQSVSPIPLTFFRHPAQFRFQLLAFLVLHENGMFRPRILAAPDFLDVPAIDILQNREEIGIDLRMTRDMLFVKMEEIARDDVDPVTAVARTQRDDGNR